MPAGINPYSIDVVICIDTSASMESILPKVKETALKLPCDIIETMDFVGKCVDKARFKVITFSDNKHSSTSIKESKFFDFCKSDEISEFKNHVNSIKIDGESSPENALEALACAVKSDWVTDGSCRKRHAIVLFTNSPTLPLTQRCECSKYPTNLPKSFEELLDWYCGNADQTVELKLQKQAKRLVIFAPHADPWNNIAQIETVYHIPITADDSESKIDTECFLYHIVNAI